MSNKQAKKYKALQNYEAHPPRCSSCKYFSPRQNAAKAIMKDGVELAPALPLIPATCTYQVKVNDGHSFAVNAEGICDEWVNRATGEIIE